ncbi:MAG: inositol monophosphatase [Gammaproteobacteria bacterium]|nr:inositol monophosphatase [Gammaproteobacteria bacterium]MBU1655109.1 inositol monophosphatase [Gammaproteobacteria bacterium]MBU1961581.1 inositol monophosphatase [Gammaproteobacteria bacterium]
MLKEDLEFIGELLARVGRDELLSRFHRVGSRRKADGSLVTDADIASQRVIGEALAARWPGTLLLGEEMSREEQEAAIALTALPLWVLDPLDGTTNYAAGIPFFAISLALIEGGEVRFGMVHDPSRSETFLALKGEGAWLNGERLVLGGDCESALGESVAMVDFKRLERGLATSLVCAPPYRSQRGFGSVALEWCWLAAGRGHLYLHGGQKLWDYAAGELILREAGGAVSGQEQIPLTLASREAVAACNDQLLQEWLAFLKLRRNSL